MSCSNPKLQNVISAVCKLGQLCPVTNVWHEG